MKPKSVTKDFIDGSGYEWSQKTPELHLFLYCFNKTSCWDDKTQSPDKDSNHVISNIPTNGTNNSIIRLPVHSTESLKDYLKRNLNNQHDCDAEIIVANRSQFDPTTICGEQFFLPTINSQQHILDLFLLFQFLDFQTAIFLTDTTLRFENHMT